MVTPSKKFTKSEFDILLTAMDKTLVGAITFNKELDDTIAVVANQSKKHMTERPFTHICRYGTVFGADRCDFKNGITVSHQPSEKALYVSDVAEMIGFHAINIHPQLNGFQGYDCIQWKLKK